MKKTSHNISGHDLDEVLAAYRPRVAAFVARIMGNNADVDDLVQETFIKVSSGWTRFRGDSALSSWIFQIASNVCADHFRAGKRHAAEPLEESSTTVNIPKTNPVEFAEHGEMSQCVKERVNSLPPSYRDVLIRRDIEGFRIKEIAEMEGATANSVKTRLCRARKKLRTILESACELSLDERNVLVCERKRPE